MHEAHAALERRLAEAEAAHAREAAEAARCVEEAAAAAEAARAEAEEQRGARARAEAEASALQTALEAERAERAAAAERAAGAEEMLAEERAAGTRTRTDARVWALDALAAKAKRGELEACAPPLPPPPSRTKWTRLVHPSVLTGHVSSTQRPARRAPGTQRLA